MTYSLKELAHFWFKLLVDFSTDNSGTQIISFTGAYRYDKKNIFKTGPPQGVDFLIYFFYAAKWWWIKFFTVKVEMGRKMLVQPEFL